MSRNRLCKLFDPLGMVVHNCNTSKWEGRQEDQELKTSLGYTARSRLGPSLIYMKFYIKNKSKRRA